MIKNRLILFLVILISCTSLGFSYGTPLLNYTFDTSSVSGTTLTNFGSFVNDATLGGNPSFVTGFQNEYISTDGVDDFIDTTFVVQNAIDSIYSVSYWINFTDIGSATIFTSYYDSTIGQVGSFYGIGGSGLIRFNFRSSDSVTIFAESTTPINDGQWHHVTGILNGETGEVFVYIDNVLEGYSSVTTNGNFFSASFKTIRIAQNPCCGTTEFPMNLENFVLWQENLTSSDVTSLFNSGNEFLGVEPPFQIVINEPQQDQIFEYNTTEVLINVTTSTNTTQCYDDFNNLTSYDGGFNWNGTFALNPAQQDHTHYLLNVTCYNPFTSLFDTEQVEFVQEGVGNFTYVINSPIPDFNYTYDVTSIDFNLSTDIQNHEEGLSCSFDYNDTNYLMESINLGKTWTYDNFSLGNPINDTTQYDISFNCFHDTHNVNVTFNTTFYKQPEPLGFEIIIPQDGQVFNYDTLQIEFHMLTNYIATCSHLTTNASNYVEFDSTNDSIHKTNFSVLPEFNTYFTTFSCYAGFVNETEQVNITFYIDEMPIISPSGFVVIKETTESGFEVVEAITGATTNVYVNIGILIIIIACTGLFAIIIVGLATYIKNLTGGKK